MTTLAQQHPTMNSPRAKSAAYYHNPQSKYLSIHNEANSKRATCFIFLLIYV
jgi:hypothetical protein